MASVAGARPLDSQRSFDAVWKPGQHLLHLDGVRGLAILLVTLSRFAKQLPSDPAAGGLLHHAFRWGDHGVDLFFVLSGFLITGILIDSRGQRRALTRFMARRSLRIFPLYFISLALFLCLASQFRVSQDWFTQARDHQVYLWTYTANLKMSLADAWCFGALDPFWSLAVEEHFYLVWPAVIFLLTRQRSYRVAVIGILVCSLSRIGCAALGSSDVAVDTLTFFRADGLLIGALLAFQIRRPEGLRAWVRPAWVVLLVAGVFCVLSSYSGRRLLSLHLTAWPALWGSLLVLLLAGSRHGWLGRFFASGSLCKLGRYSYAMYVFQSPLIVIFAALFAWVPLDAYWSSASPSTAWMAATLYIAAMFAATYAVALWSWYLIERHFLKWKKLF